jgi:gas vesicle protein
MINFILYIFILCGSALAKDTTSVSNTTATILNANPWTVLSWGTTVIAIIGAIAPIIISRMKKDNKSNDRESISELVNKVITKRIDTVNVKIDSDTDKLRDSVEFKTNEIHERIDHLVSDISSNKEKIATMDTILKELKEHTTRHTEQHRKDVKDIYRAVDSWREENREENNEIKQLIIKTLYLDK